MGSTSPDGLADTVSGNKVDARASHFKYFVRSGPHWLSYWCPISVHAQKTEYTACFWVCTLSLVLSHWLLWDFPSQIRKVLSNPQSQTRSKMSKKNCIRRQNLFMVQNKESRRCASTFLCLVVPFGTSGMVKVDRPLVLVPLVPRKSQDPLLLVPLVPLRSEEPL